MLPVIPGILFFYLFVIYPLQKSFLLLITKAKKKKILFKLLYTCLLRCLSDHNLVCVCVCVISYPPEKFHILIMMMMNHTMIITNEKSNMSAINNDIDDQQQKQQPLTVNEKMDDNDNNNNVQPIAEKDSSSSSKMNVEYECK